MVCIATSKTKPCCELLSASVRACQLIGEGVTIDTAVAEGKDDMGPKESEGFRELKVADMPCKPVKAAADTVLKTAC